MVLLFVQLDLSDNDIGGYLDEAMLRLIYTPEGSEAIAKALRASASLTSINLSHNMLGPEGAQHIGKGIAVSASLTAADLRYNCLDDVAEQGLRDVVKDRASFTLDLR